MDELFAITNQPLPNSMHGSDSGVVIRGLSDEERIAIEDRFFRGGQQVKFPSAATAVIVDQSQTERVNMDEFALLIEFALGVLTVSGFQPIDTVAVFHGPTCSNVYRRISAGSYGQPVFARKVTKDSPSNWMRQFFLARRKCKHGLHITADRFVRYSRTPHSPDALLDLCICLESLIESQSEISFRFSVCLAKAIGGKECELISDLLSDLYSFRSKLVHGADASKDFKKLTTNAAKLRFITRSILIDYIFYLIDHSKDDWKVYLRRGLLT